MIPTLTESPTTYTYTHTHTHTHTHGNTHIYSGIWTKHYKWKVI